MALSTSALLTDLSTDLKKSYESKKPVSGELISDSGAAVAAAAVAAVAVVAVAVKWIFCFEKEI